MTCRELADFLDEYLANRLSGDVRTQFEHHLRVCPNCRRYLTSYEAGVQLGKHAFDDEKAPLPADVPEELVEAILAARRRTT